MIKNLCNSPWVKREKFILKQIIWNIFSQVRMIASWTVPGLLLLDGIGPAATGRYWTCCCWTVLGQLQLNSTVPAAAEQNAAWCCWTVLGLLLLDSSGPAAAGQYWACCSWTVLSLLLLDRTRPDAAGLGLPVDGKKIETDKVKETKNALYIKD